MSSGCVSRTVRNTSCQRPVRIAESTVDYSGIVCLFDNRSDACFDNPLSLEGGMSAGHTHSETRQQRACKR